MGETTKNRVIFIFESYYAEDSWCCEGKLHTDAIKGFHWSVCRKGWEDTEEMECEEFERSFDPSSDVAVETDNLAEELWKQINDRKGTIDFIDITYKGNSSELACYAENDKVIAVLNEKLYRKEVGNEVIGFMPAHDYLELDFLPKNVDSRTI